MPRENALLAIHYPNSLEEAEAARNRLKFEELFFFQMEVAAQKRQHHHETQSFALALLASILIIFTKRFYLLN